MNYGEKTTPEGADKRRKETRKAQGRKTGVEDLQF